mgnify:CR=1 FL=1
MIRDLMKYLSDAVRGAATESSFYSLTRLKNIDSAFLDINR